MKISFLCSVIYTKLKALRKVSKYGGMFSSNLIQQEIPLKIIISAVLGVNRKKKQKQKALKNVFE